MWRILKVISLEMAGLVPDLSHQPVDLLHTPQINERVLGVDYKNISPALGGVVFSTQRNVNGLLTVADTKQGVSNLSQDVEKQRLISVLPQLPDYKGSKVEEVVEKGTLEIRRIPNRNGYALYESKDGNLIYITRLDGTRYTNVDYFRTREMLGDFLIGGYIRQGYGKIELDKNSGLWKLYNKEGKEIPILSDEYATATLNAINEMWNAVDYFESKIKKKGN